MKITMEVLAELIRANMPDSTVQITRTWKEFDGSNIESGFSWRTIIVDNYQVLTPANNEKLVDGLFTIQDAEVFINKMVERGW